MSPEIRDAILKRHEHKETRGERTTKIIEELLAVIEMQDSALDSIWDFDLSRHPTDMCLIAEETIAETTERLKSLAGGGD